MILATPRSTMIHGNISVVLVANSPWEYDKLLVGKGANIAFLRIVPGGFLE